MLRWAVLFLIVALIAGAFGLWGLEGTAMRIAEVLFVIFLILFVVTLLVDRGVIKSVEFEAPYHAAWPPEHHRRILFDSPNVSREPLYAREVIATFMERAFRRPVTKAEVDGFVALHDKIASCLVIVKPKAQTAY